MDKPLLSVCLITYNHEKYIRQAIEGVLMQKVDFDWELIIADDYSTDGTRSILQEYKTKYPGFIKLILQEKNVGPAQNWWALLTAPKSKYIAYFEGDDYWTDPLKLQKQVSFMENNPDYVQVFHNVLEIFEDGSKDPFLYCAPHQAEECNTEDLLKRGNIIPTGSIVFQRCLVDSIPSWIFSLGMGDWPVNILFSQTGKIKYLNEVMGVYRFHAGGAWSAATALNKGIVILDAYRAYLKNLQLTQPEIKICKKMIAKWTNNVYNNFLSLHKKRKAASFLLKYITSQPLYIFDIRFLKNIGHFVTHK